MYRQLTFLTIKYVNIHMPKSQNNFTVTVSILLCPSTIIQLN